MVKYIIIAAILGSLFRAGMPSFSLFSTTDNISSKNDSVRNGYADAMSMIQAAIDGNIIEVQEFLSAGIPVDFMDGDGRTALIGAAYHGQNDICTYLIAVGANLLHKDSKSFDALDFAASRGLVETVKLLLNTASVSDTSNHVEYAMLMRASFAANISLLPKNTKKFISVNRLSPEDKSPLHVAANSGSVDMLSELIKHGADVNFTTSDGQTALHWAAAQNKTFVISFLLNNSARINAVDSDGNTALMLAAKQGNELAVELLLKKGANKSLVNINAETAFIIAKKQGFKRTASLLQKP